MSATQTRALVEQFFAALNDGDHDAVLALLADDVAHDPFEGEREIGKEKFRWRLGLHMRHFKETMSDIAVMVDAGGVHAAAEFTLRGTYEANMDGLPEARGQRYTLPAGMFFEVDNGLISRISQYRNGAQWRSALKVS